ncbi:hypothetical protein ACKI1J_20415 [Streptomyces scabiei]
MSVAFLRTVKVAALSVLIRSPSSASTVAVTYQGSSAGPLP